MLPDLKRIFALRATRPAAEGAFVVFGGIDYDAAEPSAESRRAIVGLDESGVPADLVTQIGRAHV